LKPMFDLGQLGLMPFSPRDRESVLESVKNSDVVINLIGKHYETKHMVPTRRADGSLSRINYDFEEVHVDIPRTIAEICTEAGVKSMIHVSALAADHHSACRWSQSKARGEDAVREAFPEAIIVKPATIFGAEDRFLNWIAETLDRTPQVFPLLNEGKMLVQPIYAIDLAKALMAIVHGHDDFAGKTFQLAGPAEYSYKELVEFVSDITGIRKTLVDVDSSTARFAGRFVEQLVTPVFTEDMVAQLQEDVLPKPTSECNWLTMQDLEIEPTTIDKVAFEYLHRFRKGGHFTHVQGYH